MRTESVILTEQEVNVICEFMNIALKVEGLKISRDVVYLHDKLVKPFLKKIGKDSDQVSKPDNKEPEYRAEETAPV